MSTGEHVPVRDLSPEEIGFLHPNNWKGETVGHTVHDAKRISALKPISMRGNTLDLLAGTETALDVRRRARLQPQHFAPVAVYGPGQEFKADDHPHGTIILDQSTLVTRGPEFHLKPEEFPPVAPFQLHQHAPENSYYFGSKRMHYTREYQGVTTVGKGGEAKKVHIGSMDKHTGFMEYPYAVGVLALPETIVVGEPRHIMTADDQQILTQTHAVYVMPRVDGKR
ncbi:MAG TPA: hypothetical protein VLF62_03430 [Candidatus Saccharimonadales bacterium]|nr:hypothetical protein [Candidatus Saccharimonadales bacterium]